MNRIEKRKIYLDYLENLNESKSREKNIKKVTDKIRKFLNNDLIINFLVDKVVNKESSKGTKYLVWFANLILKDLKRWMDREYPVDDINIYIKNNNVDSSKKTIFGADTYKNRINIYIKYELDNLLQTIVDWLKSPLRDETEDLSKYHTFLDAYNTAWEWHEELKSTGHINEEHGKVIMTFPDGFYWIDLETTSDKDEGEAMGHCGTTSDGTTILSLRKNKSPHVTMSIDDEDLEIITQIKGRNNKKPIKKYHKYIVELMMNPDFIPSYIRLEYDNGGDFCVDDLDDELYIKLLNYNIGWLNTKFDVNRFIKTFKGNTEIYKKLLKISQLKYFNIIVKIIENKHLLEEEFREILSYSNEVWFGNWSRVPTSQFLFVIKNDIVTIKNISLPNLIDIEHLRSLSLYEIEKKLYKSLLEKNKNEITIMDDYQNIISNPTLKFLKDYKIYKTDSFSFEKVKELTKKYDDDVYIPKMIEEQKNILKFLEIVLKFKLKRINSETMEIEIDVVDFFENVSNGIKITDILINTEIRNQFDLIRYWIKSIDNSKKYVPEYQIVEDYNNYIVDNINNGDHELL